MIPVFTHGLKGFCKFYFKLRTLDCERDDFALMTHNMKTITLENIIPLQIVAAIFFPWLFT